MERKIHNTAGNVAAYISSDYTLYSIQGYCRVTYSLSETKSLDIGTVINNSDLLVTFLLVFLGQQIVAVYQLRAEGGKVRHSCQQEFPRTQEMVSIQRQAAKKTSSSCYTSPD